MISSLWKILLAIILLTNIFALQLQTDPLLRRSWIPTASAEEDQFYNKIQTKLRKGPSFVVKEDRWGRFFQLKANGGIEYILDDKYFQKFPDQLSTNTAFSEAMTLKKNGFWIESLQLLEGILFCERLNQKKRIEVTNQIQLITQEKNSILNQNLDKEKYILHLTDPYGCYTEKSLLIESSVYSYEISMPLDWNWMYFYDPDELSGANDDLSYHYNYLTFPYLDESNLKNNDEMLEKLKLAESGLTVLKKAKIVFFIGVTIQKKPIFNHDNYFQFWDAKRGLNQTTNKENKFLRIKNDPGYKSIFVKQNQLGETTTFVVREFYYWKDGKGILLALSYPNSIKMDMEGIWKGIISSFRVRGADAEVY
jgi:hypothetical protein